MAKAGYFNVQARRREKQESRDRDERLIANGQARRVDRRNGFFSVLDPSKVRLVRRRDEIRHA
jgi:hypothetical protein